MGSVGVNELLNTSTIDPQFALTALQAFSATALDAGGERELYQALCDGIAYLETYPLVWVALTGHPPQKSIAVGAKSGKWASYLDDACIDGELHVDCAALVSRALKSGAPQFADGLRAIGFRNDAPPVGDVSTVVVPIILGGQNIGAVIVSMPGTRGISPPNIGVFEQFINGLKISLKQQRSDAAYHKSLVDQQETLRYLNATLENAVASLSEALVARDPYTVGHEQRVAVIAERIAERLGFDQKSRHVLYLAGMVHDIGKIKVPIELLTKPTLLRKEEFAIIKEHAQGTYDILSKINWPWPLAKIAGQHHEKIDGSGYPDGLAGDQILPEARILAVADIIESVMSPRPYRGGQPAQKAIDIITKARGIHLDPHAVDVALALFTENPSWIERLGIA